MPLLWVRRRYPTSPWLHSTLSTKKVSTSRGPCFNSPDAADAADAAVDAAGAVDAESADVDAADVDAADAGSEDADGVAAAAAEGAVGVAGAKRERPCRHSKVLVSRVLLELA